MTKSQSGLEKKTLILDAATQLLVTKGVKDLSFENVAYEAGFSRQLVRYYYPDIETLIVHLCDHMGNAYREILVSGVVEVQQVARLDFFLDFFFGLSETHPMPPNLEAYDAMFAYSVGSDAVRDRMCIQYQTLGQVMMHELAIAHPDLDTAICEEISFVFVTLMHAHWSFTASLGYVGEHGKLHRRSMERIIASYVAEAPKEPTMNARPWTREEQSRAML